MAPSVKPKGNADNIRKTKNGKKKKAFFQKKIVVKQTKEIPPNKVEIKTSARLPTKPEEASSNWKNLIAAIKPVQTKGRKAFLAKKKECKPTEEPTAKSEPTEEKVDKIKTEADVWFDDVDPILLDMDESVEESGGTKLTKAIALDCEMVGIGPGGVESALARVSVVNTHGHCVYDKFVATGEEVTDYRTAFSGIRPHNLTNAIDLGTVQTEISEILRGRLLVGHALSNDLQALMLKHPKSCIRDTSRFKMFREVVSGGIPSLKRLAHHFLGIEIQTGEHSSIQDAQAAMRLYVMFRQQWESDLAARRSVRQTEKQQKRNKNNEQPSQIT